MPSPEALRRSPAPIPLKAKAKGRVALLMGCVQSVLDPGHQCRHHPPADAAWLRGRGLGRGSLLRLAHPPHGQGGRCALARARRIGRSMDQRPGSTRSSSPHRAAAPPSRTMATCCASIRPMPKGPRRSAPRRRTSTEFLSGLDLPDGQQALRLPIIRPVPCSMARRWEAGPQNASAQCRASRCRTCPKAISAAARPAPTTSCSRKSPPSCATARSRTYRPRNPQVIATGNIGCITQIATGTADPGGPHDRTARLGLWRAEAGEDKASQRGFTDMARMPTGVHSTVSCAGIAFDPDPDALEFLAGLHRRFDGERRTAAGPARRPGKALQPGRTSRLPAGNPLHPRGLMAGGAHPGRPAGPPRGDHRAHGPQDGDQCAELRRQVFMADLEDSNSPTWDNLVQGQINLRDRWTGAMDHCRQVTRQALCAGPETCRPDGAPARLASAGKPHAG